MSSYSGLATVERTFEIIEVLVGETEGLSVTDIVHKTQLDKSTVSRILITLKEAGYIEFEEKTRLNKLSFKYLSLTYRHINELGIENIFNPLLKRLANKTGELIQLAIVTTEGLYFISKIEGKSNLKVASMLGRKAPYHATAAGKLLLATMSNSQLLQLIGQYPLKKYTKNTITDIEELLTETAKVRDLGYSIANEEMNPDIKAIGFPVYDKEYPNHLLASIVIAAPTFKMDDNRVKELVSISKKEIESFDASLLKSFNLGFRPLTMQS